MAKGSGKSTIAGLFSKAADSVKNDYTKRRKVLSFDEYLPILSKRPRNNLRDAARYLLDAIDYFGTETTLHPWGEVSHYKIFDQEFTDATSELVGQEKAQATIRAALAAQVRDGKVNRLLLFHGPNGSAKSTIVNSLYNGLDYYSRLDEGELYRFRWVFPTRTTSSGKIGFGGRLKRDSLESFAHLEDDQIDSTLECEVRDHPLLLLPKAVRRELMETALEKAGITDYQIPDYLLHASLCHRCRQIADALMRTHSGDLKKVLAHIQVEPWAMSRRYNRALVQVGPQMSSDASQRQVTADRNLGALPVELQNMTLFETFGPLVNASGGVIAFEDMLKRPIDTYKYLLGSIENQEVALGQSILKLNSVLLATTTDIMLEAFREHHEYPSFRDRLTMIPVPYITRKSLEKRIYEIQLIPNIRRHVAPFAVEAAAHWSVLTRLHKPNPEMYSDKVSNIVKNLNAGQKCDFYDQGVVPSGLNDDEATLLLDSAQDIANEDAITWKYEGRFGASPRLIRQVLLSASLSEKFECLSPFAVVEELKELCERVREYPFLEREKQDGGYHDHEGFVNFVEQRVLEQIEEQIRLASGLVDEQKHEDLLDKYILHVKSVVKGEKVFNEMTDSHQDPDESLMRAIEEDLGVSKKASKGYRENLIGKIAGWAIDHPGQKVLIASVLPLQLRKLKESYFQKHRKQVAKVAKYALYVMEDAQSQLDKDSKSAGEKLIKNLISNHGYCKSCAKEGIARLLAGRFKEIEASKD